MIKIEMENELGLDIYINGVPDIKEIPPDKLESLVAVLEMEISKYYENNHLSHNKEKTALDERTPRTIFQITIYFASVDKEKQFKT